MLFPTMEPSILIMASGLAMSFFDAGNGLLVFGFGALMHVAFDF